MKRFRNVIIVGLLLSLAGIAYGASTWTSLLHLQKPGRGTANWDTITNNNWQRIDNAWADYQNALTDLPEVYQLPGTFNGTAGVVINLPKTVGATDDYHVNIQPSSYGGTDIADIKVVNGLSSFTVYSEGNNATDTFIATVHYESDLATYGNQVFRRWIVSPDAAITDHTDASVAGSLAQILTTIDGAYSEIIFPAAHTYTLGWGKSYVSHTGLVFNALAKTITKAGGSFITTNGFAAGMPIHVSGTILNDRYYRIDSLTETAITVIEDLVDEVVAGATVVQMAIPEYVTCVFDRNALLDDNVTGYTLWMHNTPIAPRVKVFSWTGLVTFKKAMGEGIFPEWFGCVGDATGVTGVGSENAPYMQLAFNAMAASHMPLIIPPDALYRMGSGVSLVGTVAFQYSRLAIYGPHRGRVGLQQTEDFSTMRGGFYKDFYGDHLINIDGFSFATKDRSPIISGVVFLGNRANDGTTQEEYALLRIENTNEGTIENCHFSDHLGYGVRLVNAGDITIKSTVFVRLGSTTNNAASLAVTGGEDEDEVLYESNVSNWITLENNRWENGYYHEIDIIGDSSALKARDVFMNDCKVHGRSAAAVKEEGPLVYMENAKKVYIQNTMFGNSAIACLHFVDVEPVFLVNVSLGGTWEKIIAEGVTTVYFTSGYTGPPHNKFIYVAAESPHLSFITAGSPTEITYPAHGLANGDWVMFDGIVQADWATALNSDTAGFFQVSNVTTDTFTVPVDSTLFAAYTDETGKLYWRLFKVGTDSRLYMEQSVYVFGQTRWGDFKLLPGQYTGTFKCNSQSTTRNYIWDSTLELAKASAPAYFLYGRVLGEPYPRVRLTNNQIAFGPGTATYDVAMRRAAANIMDLDTGQKFRMDRLHLRTLTAEPAGPVNGDVVYADGTSWDPGSGEGFYGRKDGNWVKLH